MATKVLFSLSSLDRLLRGEAYNGAKFIILLDENTYNLCMPILLNRLKSLEDAEFFEVPAGESCKRMATAMQLWDMMLEERVDRNAVIINLGGGSICDLGGFVAAGYKRGIRYINVPTTLVAMADAAIGGKTAVDWELHPQGDAEPPLLLKNQIGFMYHADAVCIDTVFLKSLDERQTVSGCFEMLKTMALASPDDYRDMLDDGLRSVKPSQLKECVRIKQAVVKADPNEHGLRRILNLGHTFGHAIELYGCDKGLNLTHGCAVGVGMLCAMYLSVRKLGFDNGEYTRYSALLTEVLHRCGYELPRYSLRDTEALLAYMRHDKKNADNEIRCVLLKNLGEPVIDVTVGDMEIRDTFLSLRGNS